MPSMRVVKELTIGLSESVTPNTQFTQSWLLENNGTVSWPEGCYLKLVSEINNDGKMFVPSIAPHESHILTISLVSPSELGQFKSQFCLCTPNGTTFGKRDIKSGCVHCNLFFFYFRSNNLERR